MLFQQRFWEPIRRGEVTMTFRRWKRRQAVAGNRYRTAAGIIEVDSIDLVAADSITDAEARRAGHDSAAALVADLRGTKGDPVYRIAFHHIDEPDPRDLLAAADDLSDDDVAAIDTRLARLDAASSHGAWTMAVLEVIEANPERRAGDLAPMFDRPLQPFKTDVRKLKNLGLTVSFNPGYRLSPRGKAYLEAVRRRQAL
jgi:hypothetical protein